MHADCVAHLHAEGLCRKRCIGLRLAGRRKVGRLVLLGHIILREGSQWVEVSAKKRVALKPTGHTALPMHKPCTGRVLTL